MKRKRWYRINSLLISLGLKAHEQSDFHRESHSRRIAARVVEISGNVAGQLHCVNMADQTRKYLSVLAKVFWFLITEELALMKFKRMIELLHEAGSPAIVEWMRLSNVKQR